MVDFKDVLAFIPARKGSKGVPSKNKRALGGKPLVQWSLDAAAAIDDLSIFLSTDDEEIRDIGRPYTITSDYLRPGHLANDTAKTDDAVIHALDWIESNLGKKYRYVVVLQPTSPFRKPEEIEQAIAACKRENKTVISVSKMWTHPYECVRIRDKEVEYLAKPDQTATRRQDYNDDFYFINGSIYCYLVDEIREKGKFNIEGFYPHPVPEINNIDIDTELDFFIADQIKQGALGSTTINI